jgi:hypothetical protein
MHGTHLLLLRVACAVRLQPRAQLCARRVRGARHHVASGEAHAATAAAVAAASRVAAAVSAGPGYAVGRGGAGA